MHIYYKREVKMKNFFYEHAVLIFALSGMFIVGLEYVLITTIDENLTEIIWIVLSSVIQIGGGILFGLLIRRLYSLSHTDFLTGLNNRKMFFEEMTIQSRRNAKKNGELSLLMIDLDKFKLVNDEYGHPAGDKVLVHLADLLQEDISKKGTLARVGGEEFAVLLPDTDIQEAKKIAERLKDSVQTEVFPYQGKQLSISVGVSSIKGSGTPIQLYQLADDALYQAKKQRNRVIAITS